MASVRPLSLIRIRGTPRPRCSHPGRPGPGAIAASPRPCWVSRWLIGWIRKVARGFLDESPINSPGRTGPLRVGIAGERVEDAESGVLFFQRIEFESLHDLEPRRR